MKDGIIADAKYKMLLKKGDEMIDENLSRDDLHQMITYLHITSARKGIFVNPVNFKVMNPYTGGFFSEDAYCMKIGELHGDGGYIYLLGLNIPRDCNTYEDFTVAMHYNERVLYNKLIELTDPSFTSCWPDYL